MIFVKLCESLEQNHHWTLRLEALQSPKRGFTTGWRTEKGGLKGLWHSFPFWGEVEQAQWVVFIFVQRVLLNFFVNDPVLVVNPVTCRDSVLAQNKGKHKKNTTRSRCLAASSCILFVFTLCVSSPSSERLIDGSRGRRVKRSPQLECRARQVRK